MALDELSLHLDDELYLSSIMRPNNRKIFRQTLRVPYGTTFYLVTARGSKSTSQYSLGSLPSTNSSETRYCFGASGVASFGL